MKFNPKELIFNNSEINELAKSIHEISEYNRVVICHDAKNNTNKIVLENRKKQNILDVDKGSFDYNLGSIFNYIKEKIT